MLTSLGNILEVKRKRNALGKHYLLELKTREVGLLDDPEYILSTLKEAARRGKVNVLDVVSRKFHPQGFTAVLLLSESHISIHTWPEYGYAAIDVFTCGGSAETIIQHITEAFSGTAEIVFAERGPVDED